MAALPLDYGAPFSYAACMVLRVLRSGVAAVALAGLLAAHAAMAQEKPVDENSARVTIPGCVRGRSFKTVEPSSDRPVEIRVAPGRVFRLAGKKGLLDELKKHEAAVVEITGLVRKSDLGAAQGIAIDKGGRVRVGGGPVNQDPTRVGPRTDPGQDVAVLDVESYRPLADPCPSK